MGGVARRRAKTLTRAERNAAWIERHCRIPEGRFVGQPVRLRPWQLDDLRAIYDNPHRTRRAILSRGRKNAKTAFVGFLLLLHLVGPEAVANGQLVSGAQSLEQAATLFALAAKVVRMSPTLAPFVVIRDARKQLYCPELGTLYKALSADAKTKHGMSPVFSVHDELGQVRGPTSDLYDAIETAMGAHAAPLSIVISTQAPTDADLLSILIDDAAAGHDPQTVLRMQSASLDLDPFSDEALHAANPALGDFLSYEELRKAADDAKRMPSKEAAFRNLHLNQRIDQVSAFIPLPVWKRCAAKPDPAVLTRSPVYVGLDLSSRNDLTGLVAIAQDESGVWHWFPKAYAPAEGLRDRARRDRAPYDVWVREGLLIATPGASVDYEYVARDLVELCEQYDVREIAFDRWRIDVLKKELSRTGADLPLVPFGQGFKDMSPALDAMEAEVMQTRIRHGMHPVVTWCAANAVVTADPAGNRKLDKARARGRIDVLVAGVMAQGAAARHQVDESDLFVEL